MSDRKMASSMDPIDPSDHLTFAMLANPIHSRPPFPLQWNYIINSPSVKNISDRKIASPMDPIDGSDRSIGPSDICHAGQPCHFKTIVPTYMELRHFAIFK